MANQGILEGAFGDFRILAAAHSVADDLTISTIDDGYHMVPARIVTEKVRHIRCPAFIGALADGFGTWHPGAKALGTNGYAPAVMAHDPLGFLVVEQQSLLSPEHNGNATIAVAGIALNELVDGGFDPSIHLGRLAFPGLYCTVGQGTPSRHATFLRLTRSPWASSSVFTRRTSSPPRRE